MGCFFPSDLSILSLIKRCICLNICPCCPYQCDCHGFLDPSCVTARFAWAILHKQYFVCLHYSIHNRVLIWSIGLCFNELHCDIISQFLAQIRTKYSFETVAVVHCNEHPFHRPPVRICVVVQIFAYLAHEFLIKRPASGAFSVFFIGKGKLM